MKIAISTLNIEENNITGNLRKIIDQVGEISQKEKVDIIMFPEDCFTGLSNCDIPEIDIKLGRSLESDEINKIKVVSKKTGTFVCFGFLELFEDKLFDSVIIINDEGEIIFVHRRNHNGWHGTKLQNDFYGLGSVISKIETKLGSFAILICGEITDDDLIKQTKELKADFLLFPLLRSYKKFTEEWLQSEMKYYSEQISKIRILTFMANGLILHEEEKCFGGAWVISQKGKILKSMKIFYEGYLVYDTK